MTAEGPPADRKGGRAPRCPTCRKPVDGDRTHGSFCSERCLLVDLGRWFDGAYSVPGEAAIDMDGFAPLGDPEWEGPDA